MGRMRWMGGLAAAAIIALGSGSPAHAKAIFQEDFRTDAGRGRSGRDGEVVKDGDRYAWKGAGGHSTVERGGYRITDIQGLRPEGGTVELDVTRDGTQESETLFSLADEKGVSLFSLYVHWDVPAPDGDSYGTKIRTVMSDGSILFFNTEKGDFGVPFRHEGLLLGRRIAKGQTFHVAFTWGDGGPRVYVDGKLLDAEVEKTESFTTTVIPQTKKFVIGAEIRPQGHRGIEVVDTPVSLLANIQVHDEELSPSQLAATFNTAVEVASVGHDEASVAGFSGKLVAGDRLGVTLQGTPGALGSFDIAHYPDMLGRIELDWRGWGVYLEEKAFFEEGEVDLSAVRGYRVFASQSPLPEVTADLVPLATLEVGEQSYRVESLAIDAPQYVGVVAEMRDGTFRKVIWPVQGVALAETAPGVYAGGYTVTYADRIPRGIVIGHLVKGDAFASLAAVELVAVDPALTVAVASSEEVLRADEKSSAKITVTLTDANGDAVPDHEVKFLLATTSQYTGVVGGGAFAEQVGGAMKGNAFGRTDLFGRLTATYVAGFAAKTAIVVVRDMASNSTGAAIVRTYIQATASLELEPVQVSALAEGYEIAVTSSDDWLTADGRSEARITARVTYGGEPVQGHGIKFGISAGGGSIRTVRANTDERGEARAVYTAGTKIGVVTVTATDVEVNITGSVQIELRSDAPAKIAIKVDPEKLPADGRSRADLAVTVTDINDNPNDGVEVEYAITQGGGELDEPTSVTGRNGETTNAYTAGSAPGTVTISLTVRSSVPTEEELGVARSLALAVPHFAFR